MKSSLLSLALVAACALDAQAPAPINPVLRRKTLPAHSGPHAMSGHDRADRRRDWNRFWFGGASSPSYLDFKNRVAAEQVQRWRQLMPKSARERMLQAPLTAPAGTGGTWANLGPTSQLWQSTRTSINTGRPVAIVPHPTVPTTLYLATSGGGVFKCINADLNASEDWVWTSITDDLPANSTSGNVSIGALAMSPADPNVLYVGAGDHFDAEGRGFFKSTNGGSTWTAAAAGLGNATRSWSILPLSDTRILWGTNDGLKLSTNGGSSFDAVSVAPSTTHVWSVQKFSTTELVCSLRYTPASTTTEVTAIYTSGDAGATWTKATITGTTFTPGRITLVAAGDGSTAYGIVEDTSSSTDSKVARGVLKSTDKGHTWTWMAAPTASGGLFQGTGPQMGTDGGQGSYNHGLGVDPTNPNRIVVGANLALYRSLDGGMTWAQLTHWYGSGHPYAHADNHSTAWLNGNLFVANDGGLAILRDPWRSTVPTVSEDLTFIDNRRNKGIVSHLVYNVGSTTATTPTDSKWRVSLGLQDNGTPVRQGSGTTLQQSGSFLDMLGGDGFGTLIHPTDGDKILGSLYYADVYRSTDGGASASESISGITEANNENLAPFATRLVPGDTLHPSTVYTSTNGKIYRSLDFGVSWSALGTTGLPAPLDTSSTTTTDELFIRNLGAAPSDANVLGIAGNKSRVYLTANGGTSWSQAASLPGSGSSLSCICFDPSNTTTLYVSSVAPSSTSNHLWKSMNGGTSWTAIDGASGGFPFGIPVHVVKIDPANASNLFVGTDFGVYASTNGGSTWSRYGNDLPLVAVRDLYLAPDGTFLRAATFGRGVWELQLTTSPAVALVPVAATVVHGGTQAFTPTVSNGTANTVTWTSASGGTVPTGATASAVPQTYTAPPSGTSDTVTVTTLDAPVTTAASAITLVAPSAVSVTVSPAAVELNAVSGTQQFTGTVTPLTNGAVTWSGTNVSGAGLFSAAGLPAGTYTVTAASQAVPSQTGTASVTLIAPASVSVVVGPVSPTVVLGATQTFTATVTGPAVTGNKVVTWSTSGGGTISSAGLFTASVAGSFTVTATNTFSGVTGTATVNVKTLDLNGDGVTDLRDLLFFAKNYGTADAACDLDGNGTVNDTDLTILLGGI